ncbi:MULTISPECIES: DapH/DapD/GlmU-related protein [unclassified Microbacterium]|uniref:DapH/DapD/GlmU-related protein n=1 Tax=unclassified Microbacterium TaxID=2609290 RepID=UPI003C30E2FE
MVLSIINSDAFPRSLRSRAWTALGLDVHPTALIDAGAFIGALSGLHIGERSFVNVNCFFDLAAPIHIGSRCDLGPEVALITSTHQIGPAYRRAGANESHAIHIGDGSWLGARVTVLPGVTIGSSCVIAAGAVVTTDCEPGYLYAGIPARRVRELTQGGA